MKPQTFKIVGHPMVIHKIHKQLEDIGYQLTIDEVGTKEHQCIVSKVKEYPDLKWFKNKGSWLKLRLNNKTSFKVDVTFVIGSYEDEKEAIDFAREQFNLWENLVKEKQEPIIKYFGNVEFRIIPGKDYAETEYGKVYAKEIKETIDWIENLHMPKVLSYLFEELEEIYEVFEENEMNCSHKFIEGKWYKSSEPGNKAFACYKGEHRGYGFNASGYWRNLDKGFWGWEENDWLLATEDEVKLRLIEYAEKHYKDGDKVRDVFDDGFHKFIHTPLRSFTLVFVPSEIMDVEDYRVEDSQKTILFRDGKWATKL